ncbi:GNAT family N-acetyltransferase [Leptospira bandrabouensis]|uniref:GNAT family N-acetyltransferase n=1 Tax=Leptospira bandrabouensis TaxID=2484903 RepID=A0A6H3P015_9LEPT|nr:GNAT family N-acetyltransferase [Leptospira bandrabouensis]MCG6150434.1 GNAT family N-acetyltransferase [Leptospira bandrabouensis]MCW7456747.1 GNAT family N-acetyltransferase [Leptospira bandrabouensis]MCW7475693.1 GNAT family N-acetyltransferase [Leptospira bandrabouensis]MCW7483375.1 GNAT family N-acetyltransferase [Leptospira bandrabouensis]TGN05718.1 GNAT family N-acetyltransferase [Leptospira bandrabouensis]
MNQNFTIRVVETQDPNSQLCLDHLWEEIQNRYGFQAPNPMNFHDFLPPKGRFFIAEHNETKEVLGSAAYTKFNNAQCELDAVFVFSQFRKKNVAKSLLSEIEKQARSDHYSSMVLRAGAPQPEALALYKNFGFKEIHAFGKWVSDPTAICFEKKIT